MNRAAIAALTAIAFALPAGCGEDTRLFDAEELVDAINEEGAEVELGDELVSQQEGVEVFAFGFADHPGNAGGGEAHGSGGSLVITPDDETGVAEYERCESAVTLLCYRASNVVMILEKEASREDTARIEAAITSLAAD